MSTYCRCCLWIACSLFTLYPSWCRAADILHDVASPHFAGLILRYAYLEDPSRRASLEEVETRRDWQTSQGESPHFGFTDSAWWLSFELRNSLAQARQVVIDLNTPLQDYVDWYVVDAGTQELKTRVLSGDRRHFDPRYQGNYTLSLPLTLQAGEHLRIMLRIASHDGLMEAIPLTLQSAEEFLADKSRRGLYLGTYFGCLLAFCFFGLFLFVLTRERIYLLFAGFLLLTVTTNAGYYGIGAELMFSRHPDWNNMMLLASFSAGAGMFFVFSRKFLRLPAHAARSVVTAYDITTVLLFAHVVLAPFIAYSTSYRLITYLILFNIALLSSLAIRMAWQRNVDARFFCIAFLPMGLALTLKLLSVANILTVQHLLEKNFYLAQTSLFTVVALGFSIEHSMKTLRAAMRLAQTRQLASALALKETEQKIFHLARVTTAGEITGAVVHELNQPLSSILLNSQAGEIMVKRPPLDREACGALMADITCQAKMAMGVIMRVRKLLAPGRQTVNAVQVSEIMAAAQTLLSYEIRQKDILLRQECPSALQVRGDAIQLQQVIVNLVMNSMEAMQGLPAERRTITLSACKASATHALLTVADSGIGFSSTCQTQIFSAFFTTKENGLGLGLNICSKIVAAHGGDISVRPRLPFGSIVEFTVPLHE